MKDQILVVTHKAYHFPDGNLYLPVCVGNGIPELQNKYQTDSTGENISEKNATYCELTAIYWAWKNLDITPTGYVGVNHYRRYFSLKKGQTSVEYALTQAELDGLKRKNGEEVIYVTPKRFYLTSVQHHYIYSLWRYKEIHKKDIQRLRKAIQELAPDYCEGASEVLEGHYAHMLNMFLMPGQAFQSYCEWLFPIAARVEQLSGDRKDIRRYIGALSEFMLDIWLKKANWKVVELPLLETEKASLWTRGIRYIKRKIQ